MTHRRRFALSIVVLGAALLLRPVTVDAAKNGGAARSRVGSVKKKQSSKLRRVEAKRSTKKGAARRQTEKRAALAHGHGNKNAAKRSGGASVATAKRSTTARPVAGLASAARPRSVEASVRRTTPIDGEAATAPAIADETPAIVEAATPTPAPPVALEPRLAELRDRLDDLLHQKPLSRTRVGVEVMSARDGQVLFRHNADQLFNPASNTKILSTAAALSQLGPDYRYRTRLHAPEPDEAGVIHGDVELRGAGNPSLSTSDLGELAHDVAARGVVRIDGAILADGRFRDPGDPNRAVGEQAIILNRNTYSIRVRPTSPGHAPIVEVEPATDYFTVRNAAKTVAKRRSRVRVDVASDGGRLVVTVRGRVNNRSDVVVKRRIGEAALYAAALLRRALVDFGVEVTGGVRRGGMPGKTPVLVEHLSPPLSVICRVSNKDSNNFVADTIFKTAGGERYGYPPSLEKGRRAVANLMGPLGFRPDSAYHVVNGSGLTHENRISPTVLTRLLRHLMTDLTIAPEFLASLAVGGVDGTIRNRFRGTEAAGLVRAKTGTLSGVSALSGYVGDTGDVLIFSILVEGVRRPRKTAVRHAQVQLVRAMLAYLHRGEPRRGTVVPDGDGAPIDGAEEPGTDNEDDGDVTTTEAPGEAIGGDDVEEAAGGGE